MHMCKDLHVLDTPFVTLRSGSPAGVLLLKAFFLESIPSIYIIRILAIMSRCRMKTIISPTPSHLYPGLIPKRFGGGGGPVYSGFRGPFVLFFYRLCKALV